MEEKIETVAVSEQTAEAVSPETDVDTQKTLGKFKSTEELAKAYRSLEAEFTKKSQRLKELEKEMEGARPAQVEEKKDVDWKERVDKFFSENKKAKMFAKDIASFLEQNPALLDDEKGLERAYMLVLESRYRDPSEMLKDASFIENHILTSEEIKKAVMERYFSELDGLKAPVTIKSLGQSPLSPPKKPRTIEEAGRMFKEL
ncbi:MAG: hypothetical protein GX891_03095 [Clostridiales bacterium]|nr:hypothetical protein [Clostridiales bacterium]